MRAQHSTQVHTFVRVTPPSTLLTLPPCSYQIQYARYPLNHGGTRANTRATRSTSLSGW